MMMLDRTNLYDPGGGAEPGAEAGEGPPALRPARLPLPLPLCPPGARVGTSSLSWYTRFRFFTWGPRLDVPPLPVSPDDLWEPLTPPTMIESPEMIEKI